MLEILGRVIGAGRSSPKKLGALDALVDARAVEGAAVERKDGVFVSLVEVEGEVFNLLNLDEQDERLGAFARVLNALPWPVQVTLFTEPTDVSGYTTQMEDIAVRSKDERIRTLATAEAELARDVSSGVQAEATVFTVTGRDARDAAVQAGRLVATLESEGFKAKVCGPDRLGEVLLAAYGHEGQFALSSALGGVQRALRHTRGSMGQNATRLGEVISPAGVSEQPAMLDLGGAFAATFVAVAYPGTVANGWLESILHFTHGDVRRRIALHVRPIPTSVALGEINRQQASLDTSAWFAAKQGRRSDVYTDEARVDAEELRQDLARGYLKMFEFTLLVTLIADSAEELREAAVALKLTGAGITLALRECYLEQIPAFRSTVPLGLCLVDRPRPLPTSVVCSTFPFTAGELLDTQGIFLGQNYMTGNAVVVDPRRTSEPHWVIVAATRSGKSATFKLIAVQLMVLGWTVMIVDPSPAVDYERLTVALGGSYIRFGVGYPHRINPCEILLPATRERMADPDFARPISNKVAFLKSLFELMAYPDEKMPSEVRALLEEPIFAAYAERAMVDDWESIVDTTRPSVRLRAKPSPTLSDILRHVESVPGLENLALRLRPFVYGTLSMFSGETNVRTDGRFVVFNVQSLIKTGGDHMRSVAFAMISEFIQSRLLASTGRTFVGVDEAHVLFRRPDTAELVTFLARTAGKLGGAACLMTQSITDLIGDPKTHTQVPGEEFARVYLGQVGTTLLLRNTKQNDLDLIGEVVGVSEAEKRFLKKARRGQGLIITQDDRALVQVRGPDILWPLIRTDRDVLMVDEGADDMVAVEAEAEGLAGEEVADDTEVAVTAGEPR